MGELNRKQFEGVLRNELGGGPDIDGAKRSRHPKSGWPLKVGVGRRPVEGSSPPEVKVVDYGHFPGRGPTAHVWGEPTELRREPLKHVYRGVSEEDYQGIMKSGHIQSDGRMNLGADEGTVAARDPHSAGWYLPHGEEGGALAAGRIMKIRVHPDDGWRIDPTDSYIKTNKPVPVDRIVRTTAPIHSDFHGGKYR